MFGGSVLTATQCIGGFQKNRASVLISPKCVGGS